MSYFNSISTIYQIFNMICGILANSTITPRISVPVSISIPYMNQGSKKEESDVKDLDFFQMEKLLTWMKLFFEDNEDKEDQKDIQKNAYKRELYNIYVGIRSDYKQYQNWKKYNNSLWLLSSYRSKNTKDLSKKIISDIQLFNEGLKMFSMLHKL